MLPVVGVGILKAVNAAGDEYHKDGNAASDDYTFWVASPKGK
jgi:hypothetical protein